LAIAKPLILIDIFSLPMAKPRGTIKRFPNNGKCHNGEEPRTFGAPSPFQTRQLKVRVRDPAAPYARVVCERFAPKEIRGRGHFSDLARHPT
jgi:hypothetical protein